MSVKRPALGKGLSALIPNAPVVPREGPLELPLDRLTPNHYQPRRDFDETLLDELARSITANGIIQPIVVRRAGDGYEIIAGERRWRAAQRAGLDKVPVVVRDVPDEKLLEVALIENIQREDLNPIEEAEAYQRLVAEHDLKHDAIAEAVGKDRSSVTNYLRLLKLPDDVRTLVARGTLSMGHARALLGLEDPAAQRRAAKAVVDRHLSVRDTEALVKKAQPRPRQAPVQQDVHIRVAEERLRVALGTRVRILNKSGKGRIEIDFGSEAELQRVYELLTEKEELRQMTN